MKKADFSVANGRPFHSNYLFIAFISGILLSQIFYLFPRLTIIILINLALFLFLRMRPKARTNLPILILLAAGLLYGLLRSEGSFVIGGIEEPVIIRYQVQERLLSNPSGYLYGGRIKYINETRLRGLKGKDIPLISPYELENGRHYDLVVKIKDRKRNNPGALGNSPIAFNLIEIRGTEEEGNQPLGWIEKKRCELTQYLREAFKDGDLLSSIVTGERSGLSDEVRSSFSRAGLAHILSISGTHFGLLSAFVFFLIRSFISLLPDFLLKRLTIYLTPQQASAILSLPILAFYLLLSGGSIPAIRSFIMINLFLFGLFIYRKSYWLNSLLFAALLILLWNPSTINEISFQLSFLAVLFLGYSLIGVGGQEDNKKSKKVLSGSLIMALTRALWTGLLVSFGTAPLVAYYFHYLSIISPLANISLTPLICFILLPLTLFSSFIFILTGLFPLNGLISSLTDLIIRSVRSLSSLPFSSILIGEIPSGFVVVFYALTIAFILLTSSQPEKSKILPQRKRYMFLLMLFCVCLFLVFFSRGNNKGLSITFLDVGQGDSIVIEAPGQKTFVIDTGRTGKEVESYLRFKGRDTIDAIILTHADNDHSGGLRWLSNRLRIKEIWDNGLLLYPGDIKVPRQRLVRGDLIESEGLEILVLHPYREFYSSRDKGENEYCLVLKVRGKRGASLLLAADIEEEAEEDLLHLSRWLKSDAIKISHHGSRRSTSEDFLYAVSPGIAVISVGRENPFGHPQEETIERLNTIGAIIFRTDRDGAIKLIEGQEGFNVKTFNDYAFEKGTFLKSELRNLRRLFQTW